MVRLIPGESYHIDDIQAAFQTNLGWYVKGITPRMDADGNPYVLLFSSFLNKDGSWIDGDTLFVRGEGKRGDQAPVGANRSLLDAEEDGRPVHGFRKDQRGRIWRYLGLLQPAGHEVMILAGLRTYHFKYHVSGSNIGANP